mmetsp:Transcript_25800/g.35946  ORF Transcript_25800/g.35946 Transcript_25800/m.35946 type:complete len:169 (-) Transcript_25800:150-656(-)
MEEPTGPMLTVNVEDLAPAFTRVLDEPQVSISTPPVSATVKTTVIQSTPNTGKIKKSGSGKEARELFDKLDPIKALAYGTRGPSKSEDDVFRAFDPMQSVSSIQAPTGEFTLDPLPGGTRKKKAVKTDTLVKLSSGRAGSSGKSRNGDGAGQNKIVVAMLRLLKRNGE